MKDAKSPETTSNNYDRMLPSWRKIQTLLDGTEAMRAAKEQYLPAHFRETDRSYQERLAKCTLFNMTKLTLTSWVGRPFSEEIEYEDVPPQIEALFEDVDLLGNDIQVFARDWFSDGLAKAFSHCYVDFPRTDTVQTQGRVRTLADDREENVRPHWIHLRPEQVIFADAQVVRGVEELREIRILEDITERDGFAEFTQPQIRRVFKENNVVMVELWRLVDPRKPETRKWVVYEAYTTTLSVIPLVTFYSHRSAFMLGTPPLEDLADLNIAHWQSTSEQRAVMTVARFPILASSGGTIGNEEVVIGPNRLLHTPDPAGRFYYVEHSGAAIAAGREDLLSLEAQMADYGAEFLKKKPGNATATARALDTAEATSPLQDVAIRFGHALTLALKYTALWLKLDSGGEAELETEFETTGTDAAVLTALKDTRKMKDISRVAYLGELQAHGVLCESFDAKKDATELENESLDLGGVPLLDEEIDPDTGDPIDPAVLAQQKQPITDPVMLANQKKVAGVSTD